MGAGHLWGLVRMPQTGETGGQKEAGVKVQGWRTRPEPGSGLWGWRRKRQKELRGPGVKRDRVQTGQWGGDGGREKRY